MSINKEEIIKSILKHSDLNLNDKEQQIHTFNEEQLGNFIESILQYKNYVNDIRDILIDFSKDQCTTDYWEENSELEIQIIDDYLKNKKDSL